MLERYLFTKVMVASDARELGGEKNGAQGAAGGVQGRGAEVERERERE